MPRTLTNSSNLEEIPKGAPVIRCKIAGTVCGNCAHYNPPTEQCYAPGAVVSVQTFATDSCGGHIMRTQAQLQEDFRHGCWWVEAVPRA
jgi:hypothetical protein